MDFSKLTRELNLVADSEDTKFIRFLQNFRHVLRAFPSMVMIETRAAQEAYRKEKERRKLALEDLIGSSSCKHPYGFEVVI